MADRHNPYSLSNWLHYLSHEEIDYLKRLASQLPTDPLVINIGAGGGTSAMTFFYARPDLKVHTIDIQNEITPVGGLENERQILDASGLAYQHRYEATHGDSKEVGKHWSRAAVDMVFVDGDHTYDGCAGDIREWTRHLKVGGIIVLHDYHKVEAYRKLNRDVELTSEYIRMVVKPYPGVDSAVDELLVMNGDYAMIGIADTLIAFRRER